MNAGSRYNGIRLCEFTPKSRDLKISEIHSNLIRAVTCARLAYFVDIGGMTVTVGMICVETISRNGYDQHAVAVNVNAD